MSTTSDDVKVTKPSPIAASLFAAAFFLPPIAAILLGTPWALPAWPVLFIAAGVAAKRLRELPSDTGEGGSDPVRRLSGKTSLHDTGAVGRAVGATSDPDTARRGSAVGAIQVPEGAPTVSSVADPGLVKVGRPDGSVWAGHVGPPVRLNDPRYIGQDRVQADIDGDLRWVRLVQQLQEPVVRTERNTQRVRTTPRRRDGEPVWRPGAEDSPVDERGRFRPGNQVAASRQRDGYGRFVPKTVPQDSASRPATSQEDDAHVQ